MYNFFAGPALLPEPVRLQLKEELLSFEGIGIGEISHRHPSVVALIERVQSRLRTLLALPDDYAALLCPGGATQQFSMVPLNLLTPNTCANYLLSGSWSQKAFAEAVKFGKTHCAGSSAEEGFRSLPHSVSLSDNPAYLHYTSNNTIFGTQFQQEPQCDNTTLVCDASSDLLSRPLDIRKYGLIYAGAQKNLGIAGVTLVLIDKSLVHNLNDKLPVLLDYSTYLEHSSAYNTPPCPSDMRA